MNEGWLRVKARRFLALILCVLLTFGPICRSGFADDYDGGGGGSHNFDTNVDGSNSSTWGTFWYGPNSFDSDGIKRWKTGVVAYTDWDAALYALGYGQDTVSGLTAAKKVKLMDSTTGGYFYTFAKGFKVGRPTEDFGNPVAGFNPTSMLGAWYAARAMYGETYCYWQVYSDDLRSSAKSDANTIIKGGTEVGGGGSDTPTGNPELTVSTNELVYTGNGTAYAGDTAIVKFTDEAFQKVIDRDVLNMPFKCICISSSGENNLWMVYSEAKLDVVYENGVLKNFKNNSGSNSNYYEMSLVSRRDSTNEFTVTNTASVSKSTINNGKTKNAGWVAYISVDGSSGGDGGDDEPHPKDWPKEPVAPSPPELPTPKDPTIPTPPDPVEPTPPDPPDPRDPWIQLPDVDVDIQGTDIQAILDAMNEHCIHLQNSIQDNVQQLYELQSTYVIQQFEALRTTLDNDFSALQDYLVDAFSWIGDDVIVSSFSDLKDYLYELFEWLAEQMSFETESYDDTSVLYWLKQIWGKLGAGVNTRPTDPSTDNDGWWEWLTGLLGGLVGALADIGLDKLGGLVDALDTLKDKFPFCIPWDVAALLALLVSEPVAPVVSVPMFALTATDGVQQVGSMTIDLDTYSTAWEAVRWIERIAFCVYLAMRSKDFLDLLGKIKG